MSSKECFHFTKLSRVNKIRLEGLKQQCGDNSKIVNDNSPKVSFADGRYAAAALFANFYNKYKSIKNGEVTPEKANINMEMYEKFKNTSSFEEYLEDGVYLIFDGTNIENTGGNKGHINPFDAGTKENIPPEMLKVCMLENMITGEKIYSKYDYALYLMCSLKEDDYKKMPKNLIEYINDYKEEHKLEIEKIKNGEYIEKQITIDEFFNMYKTKILNAEVNELARASVIEKMGKELEEQMQNKENLVIE